MNLTSELTIANEIQAYLLANGYPDNYCNSTKVKTICKNERADPVDALAKVERSTEDIQIAPDCKSWLQYKLFENMGICDLNITDHPKRKEFVKKFITETIFGYCVEKKTAKKTVFQKFADFLYLKLDKRRIGFCTILDNIDRKTSTQCVRLEDSYKVACLDDDPMMLSHFLLKLVVDNITGTMEDVETVLQDFKFVGYHQSVYFHSLAAQTRELQALKELKQLVRVFNIPLSRELMTSNLLLNNFGRALRQLHRELLEACKNPESRKGIGIRQLDLLCEDEPRWLRGNKTISSKDFEFLLGIENFHFTIRIFLLFLVLASNVYTFFVLEFSVPYMDETSVKLIRFLILANLLFFFSDVWNITESFHPVIHQKQVEFAYDDDYDFDLWDKTTYYVNMETVRMLLGFRYEKGKEIYMWILLILQNFLLNISRIYAATILISIMCCVLYELRKSFCGEISSKLSTRIKTTFLLWFFIVTFSYVIVGVFQFKIIRDISNNMNDTKSDCQRQDKDSLIIRLHSYMMISFFVLTILAAFFLFCYHKVKEVVAPVVPRGVQEEMKTTMISLFIATAIYIVSNSIITFHELSVTMLPKETIEEKNKISNVEIVNLSVTYHWLYLLTFIDPILHPLIIIFRIKAMRFTHHRWRRSIKLFKFSNFIKIIIIKIYGKLYPDIYDDSICEKISLVSQESMIKSLIREKQLRYRVNSIRADLRSDLGPDPKLNPRSNPRTKGSEAELSHMLEVLELQKNSPWKI
ncbi:hypothetical protein FO519_005610 [Halicephalobus sp. NKZ332]|nr:hypothetical protein FO519_005610 [Halicephalobus sp. NKZ332]